MVDMTVMELEIQVVTALRAAPKTLGKDKDQIPPTSSLPMQMAMALKPG